MSSRLKSVWYSINASYWFLPALFALVALILALTTVWLDRTGMAGFLNHFGLIEPARPQGAANMLTVIAGSMIGVASTVFSITIAAVAYASGNYGPRLLTNFMEDKGNQLSLAVFIATFVYSVTVLRAVRTPDEAELLAAPDPTALPGFVPQLSLLVAFALTLVAVAVLVYFLNHIPASIRINTVLQGIGQRLMREIEAIYPDAQTHEIRTEAPRGRAVPAVEAGYIQVIDYKGLADMAKDAGGTLKLAVRTGDFIHKGRPLAYWAGEERHRSLDEEVLEKFALGGMRTPAQDLHFLIDELVEIGVRALSPGINDPFTAITALHWLGASTSELAARDLVRRFGEWEEQGNERLVLLDDDFEHYLTRGFGAMRSALATSRAASLVAFEMLLGTTVMMVDAARKEAVRREGDTLFAQAREKLSGPDLDDVEARYRLFCQRLEPEAG